VATAIDLAREVPRRIVEIARREIVLARGALARRHDLRRAPPERIEAVQRDQLLGIRDRALRYFRGVIEPVVLELGLKREPLRIDDDLGVTSALIVLELRHLRDDRRAGAERAAVALG